MKIQFWLQSSQALSFPLTSHSDNRAWILVLVLSPTCGLTQVRCSRSSSPCVTLVCEGYSWGLAFKRLVGHILKEPTGISVCCLCMLPGLPEATEHNLLLVMTQRCQWSRDITLTHFDVFVPLGLGRCLHPSPQLRTWNCHSVQCLHLICFAVNFTS